MTLSIACITRIIILINDRILQDEDPRIPIQEVAQGLLVGPAHVHLESHWVKHLVNHYLTVERDVPLVLGTVI